MSALLELHNITKRYGRTTVLDDVSFSIGNAEIVGLLGDNGAGKSTLVKIMSGVVPFDSGTYMWNGADFGRPSRAQTEASGIETIFQDSALVDKMSITRNIFMGREVTNRLGLLRMREMNRIAEGILDAVVEIEGIRSPRQLVGSLSGGQKQAVAIARSVHFQRSLLILDEPTSALAVRATEALLRYLRHLKERGVSSVLVTHNLHHAFQVCDRHIVMNHGRKILDVGRDETSVEELTAAVVEGREGVDRLRSGGELRPGTRCVLGVPDVGDLAVLDQERLDARDGPHGPVVRRAGHLVGPRRELAVDDQVDGAEDEGGEGLEEPADASPAVVPGHHRDLSPGVVAVHGVREQLGDQPQIAGVVQLVLVPIQHGPGRRGQRVVLRSGHRVNRSHG
jgi:simple sugar transport system ATP-binding protein